MFSVEVEQTYGMAVCFLVLWSPFGSLGREELFLGFMSRVFERGGGESADRLRELEVDRCFIFNPLYIPYMEDSRQIERLKTKTE